MVTVIETGHSLGGFYAELNAYIFKGKAITYDSPGTKNLLFNKAFTNVWRNSASMKLKVLVMSTSDEVVEDNFVSFVSSPNIVNTSLGHIGRNVFRLYPYHVAREGLSIGKIRAIATNIVKLVSSILTNPFGLIPLAGELLVKFLEREAFSHSLEQMITCLDKASGEPYFSRRIMSWPNREQYTNEGIATWARCDCFVQALLCNTATANLAYEQLCYKIPGYLEGAFVVPELEATQDYDDFEKEMLRRFIEFYKGDRFIKRLQRSLTQNQDIV